jgi:hypothetical protein
MLGTAGENMGDHAMQVDFGHAISRNVQGGFHLEFKIKDSQDQCLTTTTNPRPKTYTRRYR